MSERIDPQKVERILRSLEDNTDALASALQAAESSRSHLQTVRTQSTESADHPSSSQLETARKSLKRDQNAADRARSELQQSIREAEQLLDQLNRAIQDSEADHSSLEDGRERVQQQEARSELASGADRIRKDIEKMKTWRRKLKSSLRDAEDAMSSPTASSNFSSAASHDSSPSTSYSSGGSGYDVPLDEQLENTPYMQEQNQKHDYETVSPSGTGGYEPSFSNGPEPELGSGGTESSWLEKVVDKGFSEQNADSRPSRIEGLENTVQSLISDISADQSNSSYQVSNYESYGSQSYRR